MSNALKEIWEENCKQYLNSFDKKSDDKLFSNFKTALIKIILAEKPKKKRIPKNDIEIIAENYGFNQGVDEYEKKIKELLK